MESIWTSEDFTLWAYEIRVFTKLMIEGPDFLANSSFTFCWWGLDIWLGLRSTNYIIKRPIRQYRVEFDTDIPIVV